VVHAVNVEASCGGRVPAQEASRVDSA
jgi:hypothetical protein